MPDSSHGKVQHIEHLGVSLTSGDHPDPDPHTMHAVQIKAFGQRGKSKTQEESE